MKKNLFLIIEDINQSYNKINHVQTAKNMQTNASYSTKCKSRSKTPKSQSKSPSNFKSPKYMGIMQKNIQDRLAYYVKLNKLQKTQLLNQKLMKQNQQQRQCKEKPEINQISKQIFKKIKQERGLSPNILQRFKKYQYQRVQRQAKNAFYHNQENQKWSNTDNQNNYKKNAQKSKTNRQCGKILKRQLMVKDTNIKLEKTFRKNNNNHNK